MRSDGATFTNARLLLDGNEYHACRFYNCELILGGSAPFAMIESEMHGCRFLFADYAASTLQMLAAFAKQQEGELRGMVEQLFSDILSGRFPPESPETEAAES